MRIRFEKAHDLVDPMRTKRYNVGDEATISQEQFAKLPAGVAVSLEPEPVKAPAAKKTGGK